MSCSRTQHGGGRSRTPDLSLRSQTLYHWATALPGNRLVQTEWVSVGVKHLTTVPWFKVSPNRWEESRIQPMTPRFVDECLADRQTVPIANNLASNWVYRTALLTFSHLTDEEAITSLFQPRCLLLTLYNTEKWASVWDYGTFQSLYNATCYNTVLVITWAGLGSQMVVFL